MTQFVGQSWDDLMSSHTLKWGQEDKGKTELNDICFSIKGLLELKNNIHWHLAYVEGYIGEKNSTLWPTFEIISSL